MEQGSWQGQGFNLLGRRKHALFEEACAPCAGTNACYIEQLGRITKWMPRYRARTPDMVPPGQRAIQTCLAKASTLSLYGIACCLLHAGRRSAAGHDRPFIPDLNPNSAFPCHSSPRPGLPGSSTAAKRCERV